MLLAVMGAKEGGVVIESACEMDVVFRLTSSGADCLEAGARLAAKVLASKALIIDDILWGAAGMAAAGGTPTHRSSRAVSPEAVLIAVASTHLDAWQRRRRLRRRAKEVGTEGGEAWAAVGSARGWRRLAQAGAPLQISHKQPQLSRHLLLAASGAQRATVHLLADL